MAELEFHDRQFLGHPRRCGKNLPPGKTVRYSTMVDGICWDMDVEYWLVDGTWRVHVRRHDAVEYVYHVQACVELMSLVLADLKTLNTAPVAEPAPNL